ncbi:hypothetical protein ACIQCG_14865 [Streptomyces noursei]|uniref:hypothetical protein n=1 Tax=Streptomyces noursei TaxID=1971 RepID=UPI00380769C5
MVAALGAAVCLVEAVSVPAVATGTAERAGNRLTVYGRGLHVGSVTTERRPPRFRAQARLFVERGGHESQSVWDWTSANEDRGANRVTWHLDQTFDAGDRLCTEWSSYNTPSHPGRACMVIHPE